MVDSESAEDILNEYLESIGGREAIFDETAKASRGKKRARGGAAAASSASTGGTKRTKRGHPADSEAPASKKWSPPAGSWEDDVKSIDTCEEIQNKLMVFLDWKNGQKTKHPTEVIYKKCPQKVRFFSMPETERWLGRGEEREDLGAFFANEECFVCYRCSSFTRSMYESSSRSPRSTSHRPGKKGKQEKRSV